MHAAKDAADAVQGLAAALQGLLLAHPEGGPASSARHGAGDSSGSSSATSRGGRSPAGPPALTVHVGLVHARALGVLQLHSVGVAGRVDVPLEQSALWRHVASLPREHGVASLLGLQQAAVLLSVPHPNPPADTPPPPPAAAAAAAAVAGAPVPVPHGGAGLTPPHAELQASDLGVLVPAAAAAQGAARSGAAAAPAVLACAGAVVQGLGKAYAVAVYVLMSDGACARAYEPQRARQRWLQTSLEQVAAVAEVGGCVGGQAGR